MKIKPDRLYIVALKRCIVDTRRYQAGELILTRKGRIRSFGDDARAWQYIHTYIHAPTDKPFVRARYGRNMDQTL